MNFFIVATGHAVFCNSHKSLLLLLLQYPHYPLAMYQVSGEYAMFWHASEAGAIDLQRVLMETLEGMRRAGTYFLK